MNVKSALLTAAMAAVSANSFADEPQLERHVQQF
ncbi:Hypoticical protein [Pectobacterium parmentieri]|uniref:Hypoticical protein n=1 Tax=Pectobacterium parmentieri TaxID=1905730 RepID=A0A0H3I1F5_PECPM|nr:Hypoticical protein [Pectobacterium parmentieri]